MSRRLRWTRRAALKLGLGAAFSCSLGRAEDSVSRAEAAHGEVWRRFIDSRSDVLLHYAGLKGEVVWPTPDECAAAKPSAMSWSTPIEDGPFFGGLYLDGLCNRWRVRGDEEAAAKARRIAAGLMRLADVSDTPGFVARGFAADGHSHYAASSEDQVFPWFYGLWRYLQTGLAPVADAARIRERLIATVRAVEDHSWRVPCDPPGFGFRGDFTRPHAHDAARFLFLLRVMHHLTGDAVWLEKYRQRLDESVGKEPRSRREICAAGLEFGPPERPDSYVWTQSMSQAALRGLAELDAEPAFRAGLAASARSAAPHLARADAFSRDNDLRFDVDWRFLNDSWQPQRNCEEAIAHARRLLALWAEHNPRSPYEDDTVREPLFAAWVISLADSTSHRAETDRLLARYDWARLYTSTFFIAVNLAYEPHRASSL